MSIASQFVAEISRIIMLMSTMPSKHSSAFSTYQTALSNALPSACLVVFLILSTFASECSASPVNSQDAVHSLQQYIRAASTAVLNVFQVYPPVLTATQSGGLEITDGASPNSVYAASSNQPTCQQTLLVHDFAFSYGQPYVGPYTPPTCAFNRVTWNLTVTSRGRQYDRLGTVSFGDIELFRTSTAEPTTNGIEWTYLKDMTSYASLFQHPQTIIFDLGNQVTSVLTGTFNVTLAATYFTAEDSIAPADLIVPVSKRQGAAGQPSYFTVPSDIASNELTLPQNIKKAVFTISATGQADEEFWWSNVPQSQISTFESTYGTLFGYSPFREVQLFIDGALAGVAWPFPIIFTGGVVPGLWRPIVGIDAFDLKEDEIDITPWLPLLCDGKPHNFTIGVSGLDDDGNGNAKLSGRTGSNWQVDGKVFIWLDQQGHVTTGQGPLQITPAPSFQVTSSITKGSNGTNETLLYTVKAKRSLSLSSSINLSSGPQLASWSQSLTYSNIGNDSDQAFIETNTQLTTGQDLSSSGYAKKFSYPLYAYSTETFDQDNFTLFANIQRGKDVQVLGQPVFPTGLESFSDAKVVQQEYPSFQGSSFQTTQNGTALYEANQTAQTSFSYGTTSQEMSLSGLRATVGFSGNSFPSITGSDELFHRSVLAVNGSVVKDNETLIGQSVPHEHGEPDPDTYGHGLPLSGVPGRGSRLQRFQD